MNSPRYKAFISYSHQDQAWGAWLQRVLEHYRVPRRLAGSSGPFGPIPRRLGPVFRDREDLSSAADLSSSIKQSLAASETLIVVCSPSAAQSSWVSEEIRYFQALGRADRVFALIVDGDPQAGAAEQGCFPQALVIDSEGQAREPLAADLRPWADGKLLAKLKLVAGILGIRLDDLRRRDLQRRQRLWVAALGATLAVALAMGVLAVMAVTARNAAENRREHAEELVGYMVGDLKAKLDEVGRLDILEGMGDRVSEYLQTLDPDEVTDESLIQQARVWRQLGEVSKDQADLPRALEAFRTSRDILSELQRRNPENAQFVFELGSAEFWVGYVLLESGRFDAAESAFNDYLGWAYRLTMLEPGKPEWLMEQSYAHSNLAALAIRRGNANVDDALLHIGQAGEINRQVLALVPDDPTYLSEYGEVLAWQADTQMQACDLGGALQSRQENVDIARRQMELAPANVKLRQRYAYSLTGLASVAEQVGSLELAEESYIEARDILAQLSVTEPGNTDLRFEYLMREAYAANVAAQVGDVDAAARRLLALRQPLDDLLVAEESSNLRWHISWLNYMLNSAELAARRNSEDEALELLEDVAAQLARLLQAERTAGSLSSLLIRARFMLWELRGEDLLQRPEFAGADLEATVNGRACTALVNGVRQAILKGDRVDAQALTDDLLQRGYFEPSFIRSCGQYALCPGPGEAGNSNTTEGIH